MASCSPEVSGQLSIRIRKYGKSRLKIHFSQNQLKVAANIGGKSLVALLRGPSSD